MTDPRILTLADNLISYSCALQAGENILIEAFDADFDLVNALVRAAYRKKAYPYVKLNENRIQRELLMGTDETHLKTWAKHEACKMADMQAYIGVRGGLNAYELSDVPGCKMDLYSRLYAHPVHHEIRVAKTKWVVLRYPGPALAQLAGKPTDAFEDFYFNVCNLDYSKMDKAMEPLKKRMEKADKVRITGKGTDLAFSVKGMPAIKCSGERNIPDGEIYTAPVKNSVNGVITYNAPSIENGLRFEDVRLEFKDGKVVKSSANHAAKLEEILNTDGGARYIGEFAFGVNPYITAPTGDILFDEKISGSIHFTPGQAYDDADNGNRSAVHWDLVFIQTPEYGGGEIWFDGQLIRKDGRFVLPELAGLNPEN
ncbi:MAG: aminopeptidase, partial [Clostridiales bacterium]|nr:aminopeptidase [Clostridiales bacterium]